MSEIDWLLKKKSQLPYHKHPNSVCSKIGCNYIVTKKGGYWKIWDQNLKKKKNSIIIISFDLQGKPETPCLCYQA